MADHGGWADQKVQDLISLMKQTSGELLSCKNWVRC